MTECVCVKDDDLYRVADILEDVKSMLVACDEDGMLLDRVDGVQKWCVHGGCTFKDMLMGVVERACGEEEDVYSEIGMSLSELMGDDE